MSGLHRDKGATHNFSVMWKIREDSRNKREMEQADRWGARPHLMGGRLGQVANHVPPHGLCLHHL
jgi:hypothetical protein